jgi:hypothetical protein
MFRLSLTVFELFAENRFRPLQRRPLAEKIFIRKFDPDFLLVFCWHFASISNHFRVIHDVLLANFTSHVTEMLDDVTDRKWRHQSICRPWFPISVQYMFWVYCVPFTSYLRFWEVNNGRLSISAARGAPTGQKPLDRSFWNFAQLIMSAWPLNLPEMVTIGWIEAAPHVGEIWAYILYLIFLYIFFVIDPIDQTTEPICTHDVSNDAD